MKLIIDERLKHRLIGLAVILSIATIFVPAIMKKSNQRFDKKTSISIKLPPKPPLPNAYIPKKEAMFRAPVVAHVEIPTIKENKSSVSTLVKAEPISQPAKLSIPSPPIVISPIPINNTIPVTTKSSITAKDSEALEDNELKENKLVANNNALINQLNRQLTVKKINPHKPHNKKTLVDNSIKTSPKTGSKSFIKSSYSVQLASFSQQKNAVLLVNKLSHQGYKAFFNKNTRNGTVMYKVLVGRATKKQEALLLQKQLANRLQLKGMIVSMTGVS